MTDFGTKEYQALRKRVVDGESKLVRERDQNGDHHLQEIPSPGKRYEDRGISLTALFDHCEGLFEDAQTSEAIITALIADRAHSSWNNLYLTVTISLSILLNLCYTYWWILETT